MKVDNILILAAGKGTRMGEIGKNIPKVLWPIFDKTLLEWQVLYARKFAENAQIYINIFNFKDKIKSFVESHSSFEGVNFVYEREELDVGGAIHNLASELKYKGNLLIINGDQFLFFDQVLKEIKMPEKANLMFTYEVNSSDGYNQVLIEKENFIGVKTNDKLPRNKKILTYTGMSIVSLPELTEVSGKSKFFESVLNQNLNDTYTLELTNLEYWDFGTLDRYIDSFQRILSGNGSKINHFLEENGIDLKEKIKEFEENKFLKFGDLKVTKDQVYLEL